MSDRIAQIATDFTSIEIKHFRNMVCICVLRVCFNHFQLQAFKSANEHELHVHSIAQHLGLSRPQAQNLLNSFIEHQWIELK